MCRLHYPGLISMGKKPAGNLLCGHLLKAPEAAQPHPWRGCKPGPGACAALNRCPSGIDSWPLTETETRLCRVWGEGCPSAGCLPCAHTLQTCLSTRALLPCPFSVAPSVAVQQGEQLKPPWSSRGPKRSPPCSWTSPMIQSV